MTKVKLHPTLIHMHGKMGDMVFRRTPGGGMSIIQRADMSRVTWSEAQKNHRKRFKAASAYAKAAMADETLRGYYEQSAAQRGKSPYHLAISDYFKGINRFEQGR